MQELDDAALLREYVERDSEEAFAALVARHINKVYSVAMRHTGNPHQAEEITQAVFVILAQKSRNLGKRVLLSGWLYQTARLTAVTFLRSEIRRARREQQAHMRTMLNEGESDVWAQIAPLLDAAMGRLNATDRHAVVLRFFDGKSMKEVGTALGGSEDAAKMRVNRAVGKLQEFFLKQGVTSTTEAISGAISVNTVQAAPTALVQSVTTVALAKGATASVSTLTLIKGALKVMAWTKAKTAIVAGVVILTAAGSTTVAIHHFSQKSTESSEDAIRQFSETPNGALSLEAVKSLMGLKLKGQLPGIASNAPAGIEIPWYSHRTNDGTWHLTNTNVEGYPISLTLTVLANDVNYRYHYTITKASETNRWQLRKAWCADTNGTILKKFLVPSNQNSSK